MEKACCFIDILGFKEAVNNGKAFEAIGNYQGSIEIADLINSLYQDNKYASFCDFIPMSDSIFITSENPDLFLKDLSVFLAEIYLYNSATSNNITLFKGAVSYGEIECIEQICKVHYKTARQNNIVGKALNNAVLLDYANRQNKGPRIFIDDAFYSQLKENKEKYILDENGIKEILWPYYTFDSYNSFDTLLPKYEISWLMKTLDLYNHYKNLPYAECYKEFVNLVIKTAVRASKRNHSYKEMKEEFIRIIEDSKNTSFINIL